MDTSTLTSTIAPPAIEQIFSAVQLGQWSIAAGLTIMALVWLVGQTKMIDGLPEGSKKWFALGLAIASSIGAGIADGWAAMQIVSYAIGSAVVAIGGWEVIGRTILSRFQRAPAK